MIDALFLSAEDLTGLADPGEYVPAVREAYRQRGEGAPTEPRTSYRSEEPAGLFNSYTTVLPDTGVMGGYVYSAGFSDGDARFVLPLFDADTGRPLAVMDGAPMNTYKTGAAGAVAVDALARGDASEVAIVGSGAQARGQLRAIVTVRDVERVRVFSPTADHREEFAETMSDRLGVQVDPVESTADAVADADVVVTATNASEPVVDFEDLPSGVHVNAIGQYDPEKREIDTETVANSTYVPDLRERVFQDAGAFLLAREEGAVDEDDIHAELGDVVAGNTAGRTTPKERTVFDSGGTALETVGSAALLYERALEEGLGERLPFADASETYPGKQGSSSEEL